MARFIFFGKSVELPAILVPQPAPSRDRSAWQAGMYATARLIAPMVALRVHTDGKWYPGRDPSRQAGVWLLIGEIILTSAEIAASRSLPARNPRSMLAFRCTSEAYLKTGTVLHFGLASAKFGGSGGEFQAEFVSGPPIIFTPLHGKEWHSIAGNA